MSTDVVMPQMGESIAEGTIVRWLKQVGERVDRDEPLFEISTDKVDAEIPSPAAGLVMEIRHKEGETVPVNVVVAVIGEASVAPMGTDPQVLPAPASVARPQAAESLEPAPVARPQTAEGTVRQRSSPLVRKIAKDRHVDISRISGTGISGRVTKNDILGFLGWEGQEGQETHGSEIVKMSVIRKRIAEHMVMSRRTSAHVHSVFEVDFSRVAKVREAKKAEFEAAGAKLTFLSFILKAVVEAIRSVPVVNASIDGDNIVFHKETNIGVAVTLDWGLIVPVIRSADKKDLLGLSLAVADLANRARAKQLKPDEVAGGTFTITNPGGFGALFGLPIINQPQVAILGVGTIEKRAVVIDDAVAIRPMGYLTLGFDHRLIDGVVADEFMSHVKRTLESWNLEGD